MANREISTNPVRTDSVRQKRCRVPASRATYDGSDTVNK